MRNFRPFALLTAALLTAAAPARAALALSGMTWQLALPDVLPAAPTPPVKNVIVMIADGTGTPLLDSVRYWTGKPLTVDGPKWGRASMATYALRRGPKPAAGVAATEQDPTTVYDPVRAYDATPVSGTNGGSRDGAIPPYPKAFKGYDFHRSTAPDSANTMSAMMTGVSSYNGAINVNGAFEPSLTVAEVAHARGKRVGSITTVPFDHATPAAGGGAHNVSRGNYHELADELLTAGVCDVLAGGGDPNFDNDAKPLNPPSYAWVAQDQWTRLQAGIMSDVNGKTWTLVQATDAIRRLADGPTPDKLIMVPPVLGTLQQKRSPATDRTGDGLLNDHDALHTAPGDDGFTPGLPDLADLARASLNALDDDPDGFFLMVEGGATDWAEHDNELGRGIEEYEDFDKAVRAVSDYLDAGTNGNTWANTLVVVTADHDHLMMGPDGDKILYQPVTDNGAGKMPGHRWMSGAHSNRPVPIFFRGAGSELIGPMATRQDVFYDGNKRYGSGPYFHETDLGKLLLRLVGDATPGRSPTTRPVAGRAAETPSD